jgi:Mlc titration factor MtfA (ptsG expression regulator)
MLLFTTLRRKRLKNQPFPSTLRSFIERNVPLFNSLPEDDRQELQGHIQVLQAEKHFEGQGGLTMSDEIRVTISAQACFLLLHRETDYFPGLSSIVVYPGEYLAPYLETDECGIVTEGTDRRSGEACREGTLVLSWEDVVGDGLDVHEGYNVVIHEFAHQIDAEEGLTSPPLLGRRAGFRNLKEVLARACAQLEADARLGRPTVLDPYGAANPAELFAVATESFFQTPRPLRESNPHRYAELVRFYRQNPAEWPRTETNK